MVNGPHMPMNLAYNEKILEFLEDNKYEFNSLRNVHEIT